MGVVKSGPKGGESEQCQVVLGAAYSAREGGGGGEERVPVKSQTLGLSVRLGGEEGVKETLARRGVMSAKGADAGRGVVRAAGAAIGFGENVLVVGGRSGRVRNLNTLLGDLNLRWGLGLVPRALD